MALVRYNWMYRRLLCLGVIGAVCYGIVACQKIIVENTPPKKPIPSKSALARTAENYFWKTLHQGRYEDISHADYLLMAAYLENSHDPKITAHLGFLHIWKMTERQRDKEKNPLIVNEITLAKKYFSDALELDPKNPIYRGFLGDSMLVEGQIGENQREQTQAYFMLQDAIAQWPAFNYFTAGYPMSTLPATSKYFLEGLEWQWLTLDVCAGTKVNRKNPDFSAFMSRETRHGSQRACWNSWAAPYNFEGFFMNMGDMLVKSGDWQTAILIYKNAKLAKNYASWPYRSMLESRIKHAKANVDNFQKKYTRDL